MFFSNEICTFMQLCIFICIWATFMYTDVVFIGNFNTNVWCVFVCVAEVGVGLGIGLCCVPSAEGCPGIYIHTLSPGSVAHMDGRLR